MEGLRTARPGACRKSCFGSTFCRCIACALLPLLVLAADCRCAAHRAARPPKAKLNPKTAAAPLDPNRGRLPAIKPVTGPLDLAVVYPAKGDVVSAGEWSFLFGSTGTGDARLTINGDSVKVWPNGAFLAWLRFPPDSVMAFNLVAVRTGGARDSLTYRVRRAPRAAPPTTPLWIDTLSFTPQGRVWWPADEYLPLSVRAAEGSELRLVLPDGTVVPLANSVGYDEVSWGVRAFDRDTASLARSARADRYVGVLRGRAFGADPGPLVGAEGFPGCPRCGRRAARGRRHHCSRWSRPSRGADTVRARWPLRVALLDSLPTVVEMDDDTARHRQDRPADGGARGARRHLQLVLPDRHPGQRVRPAQRRPPPPALRHVGGVDPRRRRAHPAALHPAAHRDGGLGGAELRRPRAPRSAFRSAHGCRIW